MKHLILYLFIVVILSAHTFKQDVFLKYVTINLGETSLINTLNELQNKSDLQFVYSQEKLESFQIIAAYDSVRIDSILLDIKKQLPNLTIDSYDNIVVLKRVSVRKSMIKKDTTANVLPIFFAEKKQIIQFKEDTLPTETKEIYVESKKKFENIN